MKDRLSALMDGELDDRSAAEAIDALGRDREALETWQPHLEEGIQRMTVARLAWATLVLTPRA